MERRNPRRKRSNDRSGRESVLSSRHDQQRILSGKRYPHGVWLEREASYYNVVVNGQTNKDAAWYYPSTKPAADEIKGYVAFWRGVKVEQ